MKMNPRLPKGKAKIILGSLIALFLLSTILFFLLKKTQVLPQSNFSINFQKNKFNFSTNLTMSDQKNMENMLNTLLIPTSISNGFEFGLDSTSSAKLGFSTPINGTFDISDKTLEFKGTTALPLIENMHSPKNFKIPQSVQIKVFGTNLHTFVFSRLNMPPELYMWSENNFQKNNPEYMLIFNNGDIALLWTNPKSDFTSLKDYNPMGDSYKEEVQEDITFYLYKLPKNKFDQDISLSFMNIGDFSALVTNQFSAKELVKAIRNPNNSQDFIDDTDQTSFYLNFQNTDSSLSDDLRPILFGEKDLSVTKENIFQTISKITEFKLTLKANAFSGLINRL